MTGVQTCALPILQHIKNSGEGFHLPSSCTMVGGMILRVRLRLSWQGSGWFCMRIHFYIKVSFIIDTKGLYCVTKGNISFSSLLFCFRRAGFLSVSFTSNSNFSFPENCVASLCPSSAFEI